MANCRAIRDAPSVRCIARRSAQYTRSAGDEVSARFFKYLVDLDIGNAFTVFQLDDLFRQQPEAPTSVSFRRLAAGQGCDLGPHLTVDLRRAPRTWGIFQAL